MARRITESDFERSESSSTPAGPSTAGCPQRSEGTQTIGSPFLCLLSFGEAKESELPPGNPGLQVQARWKRYEFSSCKRKRDAGWSPKTSSPLAQAGQEAS